jgi:hypothetical protein
VLPVDQRQAFIEDVVITRFRRKGSAVLKRADIYNCSAMSTRNEKVIILAEESVSASMDGTCHSGIRDVSELHFSLPRSTLDAMEALHHALEALPHLACSRSAHTLCSRPESCL